MVHHVVLFNLKPEVTPQKIEEMMMTTRMMLLKIPEVMNLKCGKRIAEDNPWQFFIAMDFESMDKLGVYREDPIHLKYAEEVLKPNIADRLAVDYEMEPGKDVRFS